jgi:hypothetical protein
MEETLAEDTGFWMPYLGKSLTATRALYLPVAVAHNKEKMKGTLNMPLSGEAIRMMNYVDDVSTTLRRILSLVPTLTTEERQRVSEYLNRATPNVEAVTKALKGS